MAQTSIQSLEKIAKTSEDTKKLLGKLTKLNNQIGKKDETQTTKLSSLVRKVADSSFTPTFLQKFLRKPDKEGNDLATRLENTQNKIVGSIVNVFKNKEAKESARLNIEISKLRELQAIQGVTKEEIEGLVAKEESKELTKKLDEVKEANTKSFENLVQMFKLDTSALETFTKEEQDLLKQNINVHGDVKKILQNTELKHHETVQALEKIVSASHEKGSLFVHDINTQKGLDQLNKFNEIEIEMARDKIRKDDISALQDKENQKQLLNATKAGGMGAAGMGAAGGESGSGIGFAETYLLLDKGIPTVWKGIKGIGKRFMKFGPKSTFFTALLAGLVPELISARTGSKDWLGALDKIFGPTRKNMTQKEIRAQNDKIIDRRKGMYRYTSDGTIWTDPDLTWLQKFFGGGGLGAPIYRHIDRQKEDLKSLNDMLEESSKNPLLPTMDLGVDYGHLLDDSKSKNKSMNSEFSMDYGHLLEDSKLKDNYWKGISNQLSIQTNILLAEINKKGENRVGTIVSNVQDNKKINNINNATYTNSPVNDPFRILLRSGING